MAYQSNLTITGANGLVDPITTLIAKYRVKMARRKVYRETLRELRALSPRDLNDLGMNYSMLKRVAYQAAYEK